VRPDASRHLPLADELSVVFARISGLLLSQETVETSLELVGALALETVPRASGVGVSIIDERGRRSAGSTDRVVERADALQYELDEGPCLAATAARQVVRVPDLATDDRWPRWAAAAAGLGLAAAISVPLSAGEHTLGALKVYATTPGELDGHTEQVVTMFAAQAAVLVANVQSLDRARRTSDDLRQALAGRDLISTAKGVLMARHGIGEEAALGMLLARTGDGGGTMRQAARAVVDSAVRRRR
jgi:GAF domain-containing protein